MQVVRVVRHRVQALGAALRDVVLVGCRGELVCLDGVGEPADPLIDVARHVDHVAGGRHQRQQGVGGLLRFLRRRGAFHQVDVHVRGARMFGVPRQHPFGQRHDLGGALVRRAVALPVAPRAQVHHRFDIEHRRVDDHPVALVKPPHRRRVRLFAGPGDRRPSRIARRQRSI